MGDIFDLKKFTKEFFALHWNKASNQDPPHWSEQWHFDGPVPNNELKGCYAFLLETGEVVYIGVALNSGQRGYEGHSLGVRISKYWSLNRESALEGSTRKYRPSSALESYNIDSIVTLAFPVNEQEYLAAALEIYLIKRMIPKINKLHK